MKIFLDTAHLEKIKQWTHTGLVDGITTNPSNLSKEGKNPTELLKAICKTMDSGDVSAEITQESPQDAYKQAHALAKIAKNIVVKIPCAHQYYPIIKTLVDEGVAINVTLVFTLAQGMFMSKLGVKYISPFVGRWDDIDGDGAVLLYELRKMIDQYNYKTKILAASLRTVRHLHQAIDAGADVATLPVELFEKSMDHLLTQQGIEKFNADWQKLGVKQFP